MPSAFNFSASPFDCLNPGEQRLVRDSVDIVYFRDGETILDIGIAPTLKHLTPWFIFSELDALGIGLA